MKRLYTDKWRREIDSAQMEVSVDKVDNGIISTMYVDGQQVLQTQSKRPYTLGQPCDGTTDECVHALFIHYCLAKGLDPQKLYHQAYPESTENCYSAREQQRIRERAEKQGVEIPRRWGEKEIDGLIKSLTHINNHSLVEVIGSYLANISKPSSSMPCGED